PSWHCRVLPRHRQLVHDSDRWHPHCGHPAIHGVLPAVAGSGARVFHAVAGSVSSVRRRTVPRGTGNRRPHWTSRSADGRPSSPSRDPALHRIVLYPPRLGNRGDRRLVRHFVYRLVSGGFIQLQRRGTPVAVEGRGVRAVDGRRVPTVFTG